MTDNPHPQVHCIRLRGPWQYHVVEQFMDAPEKPASSPRPTALTHAHPASGRLKMPADWGTTLGEGFRGRVAYQRHFHCPTGLTSTDRVWLVVQQVDSTGTCHLNGHDLGTVSLSQSLRVEVSELLLGRNSLSIEVSCPAPADTSTEDSRGSRKSLPGGLIGEVRLEIERPDAEHRQIRPADQAEHDR